MKELSLSSSLLLSSLSKCVFSFTTMSIGFMLLTWNQPDLFFIHFTNFLFINILYEGVYLHDRSFLKNIVTNFHFDKIINLDPSVYIYGEFIIHKLPLLYCIYNLRYMTKIKPIYVVLQFIVYYVWYLTCNDSKFDTSYYGNTSISKDKLQRIVFYGGVLIAFLSIVHLRFF